MSCKVVVPETEQYFFMPQRPPTQSLPRLRSLKLIQELLNGAFSKGNKSLMTNTCQIRSFEVSRGHKNSM